MDLLCSLSSRLRELSKQRPSGQPEFVPPPLEEWLRFWNDDDSDLGNLRNLEHWLQKSRRPA